MTPLEDSVKRAIDEALGPLIADHRKYLADVDDPLLAVGRADLHYVFDQYNTQLLDFSAAMAPIGHRHPFVHDAIKEHMDYYIRTAPVGDHVLRWPVEYAKNLVDTFTPEDTEPRHQVLFTEGEREAVLTAIQVARQLSRRFGILIVENDSYNWLHSFQAGDQNLLQLRTEEFWLNDVQWDKIGCVLMSLTASDGCVLEPRWVQEVADYAKQNQAPLIIDESRTGFGRFGTMWGQQHHQVDADITVLGGPVGGGLPLGAVITSDEQFQRVNTYVSPQAGSPVACCAGAGTLRAINPGVLEHVKETAGVFDDALQGVVSQFPEYVAVTHGTGFWRTLEFQHNDLARQFEVDTRKHGLLTAAPVGSSVILTPPLIASEMEIKRGVDLIADTLLDWQEADA